MDENKTTINLFQTAISLSVVAFLILGGFYYFRNDEFEKENKAQVSEGVEVTAEVRGCILELIVYPEKRVPATGNWGTTHHVDLYESGTSTLVGSFSTPADDQGVSTTNLCSLGIDTAPGNYDLHVRGDSHLVTIFPNNAAFYYAQTDLDLTVGGEELYAGETSVVFDNYINSLDISTQVVNMFSSDYINDLNQDGKVNSLDISNTVHNFYFSGD